jgi:hypothetical protein
MHTVGVERRSWLRRLLRPEPKSRFWLGWGDFPPLPDSASEVEVLDYLDRCFAHAALDGENQLTVTIRDPEQAEWIIRFPRASLSVARWPDNTVSEDWASGIQDLSTSTSRTRQGLTRRLYEMQSKVNMIVEAESFRSRSAPDRLLGGSATCVRRATGCASRMRGRLLVCRSPSVGYAVRPARGSASGRPVAVPHEGRSSDQEPANPRTPL